MCEGRKIYSSLRFSTVLYSVLNLDSPPLSTWRKCVFFLVCIIVVIIETFIKLLLRALHDYLIYLHKNPMR